MWREGETRSRTEPHPFLHWLPSVLIRLWAWRLSGEKRLITLQLTLSPRPPPPHPPIIPSPLPPPLTGAPISEVPLQCGGLCVHESPPTSGARPTPPPHPLPRILTSQQTLPQGITASCGHISVEFPMPLL